MSTTRSDLPLGIATADYLDVPTREAIGLLSRSTGDDHEWLIRSLDDPRTRVEDKGMYWVPLERLWVWPVRVFIVRAHDDARAVWLTCDHQQTDRLVLTSTTHPEDAVDESLGGDTGHTRALSAPDEPESEYPA